MAPPLVDTPLRIPRAQQRVAVRGLGCFLVLVGAVFLYALLGNASSLRSVLIPLLIGLGLAVLGSHLFWTRARRRIDLDDDGFLLGGRVDGPEYERIPWSEVDRIEVISLTQEKRGRLVTSEVHILISRIGDAELGMAPRQVRLNRELETDERFDAILQAIRDRLTLEEVEIPG